jgi:hypothetical protein
MKAAIVAVLLAVAAAACGGSEPAATANGASAEDPVAVVANADIGVGRSRLLVGIAASDGARLGSPDEPIAIEVAPAERPELRQRAPGAFTWIIEGAFGLYRAEFDFDRPGTWAVTVVPEASRALEPTFIQVGGDTIAPGIGDAAPLVPTPTVASSPLQEITTDPEPDSRFYELSLDDAARSGTRTVAVFSTPAFCRTAACGPMLEQVKGIAPEHPDVNFVHVEIYAGFNEPDFVPDGSHLAPAVTAAGWNLPSEPWVFVIDKNGIISHRFEGVMDPSELVAALG